MPEMPPAKVVICDGSSTFRFIFFATRSSLPRLLIIDNHTVLLDIYRQRTEMIPPECIFSKMHCSLPMLQDRAEAHYLSGLRQSIMMQKAVAGFFLLFFLPPVWTTSPAQELHTYVDRDSVEVGDYLIYTLLLSTPEPYRSVRFPGEEELSGEELDWVDRQHFQLSAQRDSVVYRLQFFGVDNYRIPSLPIVVTWHDGRIDTLRTAPVPLFFKTVLEEGDTEYRPLKPIFEFSYPIGRWILLLLFLLILAAAGWQLYKYWLKQQEEEPLSPEPPPEPVPFTDPLVLLKERLEALSGSDSPLKRRDFHTFYTQLGDAIRHYIEQVYEIDALEMTSGEIVRALRNWPAEKEVIESTRDVLQEADLVKFARFQPDISQAEKTCAIAFDFHDVASRTDRTRIDRLRELHEMREMSRKSSRDLSGDLSLEPGRDSGEIGLEPGRGTSGDLRREARREGEA